VALAIRADSGAPFGEVVKVKDAAKEAGIRTVNAFTRNPAQK
jgi:biopolymer transport protein ExbD